MSDYGSLAYTGAGGLVIGQAVFSETYLLAAVVTITVGAALLIRSRFRRGTGPGE